MPRCYLGLGSNLKSPRRQLNRALHALKKQHQLIVVACSGFHLTKPIGVRAQPMFYNIVVCVETRLSPLALLKVCQRIEQQHKRVRKKKWGTRTLDIDLLFYGNLVQKTLSLTLPHPEWSKRDFVCIPLFELQHFSKNNAKVIENLKHRQAFASLERWLYKTHAAPAMCVSQDMFVSHIESKLMT